MEKAIAGLLDLVEKYTADSADPRLMEREAEKARLAVELRPLEHRTQFLRLAVSPEEVEDLLKETRAVLASEDVHARRARLSNIIARVKMGSTGQDALLVARPGIDRGSEGAQGTLGAANHADLAKRRKHAQAAIRRHGAGGCARCRLRSNPSARADQDDC